MSRRGGGRQNFGGGGRNQNFSDDATLQQNKRRKPCSEETLSVFGNFKIEIDERNDKWERIVKCSRDVTIESKRVIFLLHRLSVIRSDDENQRSDILQEAEQRLISLRQGKLKSVALELVLEDPNRFLSAYRPGLEEYIEAASLLHYLKFDELLTWNAVKESLQYTEVPADPKNEEPADRKNNEPADRENADVLAYPKNFCLTVPLIDYLCGIGDLTGELMRSAISYVSAGNFKKPEEIRSFLTQIYRGFVFLGHSVYSKDFAFKLKVAKQNLEKVENACYMLNLRSTEVPEHMLAEVMTNLFTAPMNNNQDGYSQSDLDQSDV